MLDYNEVISVKKYSPDGDAPLQSSTNWTHVPNCLTSADKQNMNDFVYRYIATRSASCISSEYRYTYTA